MRSRWTLGALAAAYGWFAWASQPGVTPEWSSPSTAWALTALTAVVAIAAALCWTIAGPHPAALLACTAGALHAWRAAEHVSAGHPSATAGNVVMLVLVVIVWRQSMRLVALGAR